MAFVSCHRFTLSGLKSCAAAEVTCSRNAWSRRMFLDAQHALVAILLCLSMSCLVSANEKPSLAKVNSQQHVFQTQIVLPGINSTEFRDFSWGAWFCAHHIFRLTGVCRQFLKAQANKVEIADTIQVTTEGESSELAEPAAQKVRRHVKESCRRHRKTIPIAVEGCLVRDVRVKFCGGSCYSQTHLQAVVVSGPNAPLPYLKDFISPRSSCKSCRPSRLRFRPISLICRDGKPRTVTIVDAGQCQCM